MEDDAVISYGDREITDAEKALIDG